MRTRTKKAALVAIGSWLVLLLSGAHGAFGGDFPGTISLADAQDPNSSADSNVPFKQPENTPASPETQPASTSWPPGLMMEGLNAIGLGQPMSDLGLRAYGYIESGFTGILRGPGGSRLGLPLRVFDARKPDNLRMNQLKFTLDRVVDTSKSFDFGGRGDFIYGTDSRLIHSPGLLDKQRHDIQPDLEQFYAEMWIKTGEPGTGFDIVFGKWVTPSGAEVIDGPSNYLYSRSMLFGYTIPFTHTGVKVAYQFDSNNLVYAAAARGWDVFNDNNDGATWLGGFLLSSTEQMGGLPRSQLAFCGAVGPEQTGRGSPGNRLVLDAVWTWRWTEKLTQVVDAVWGYEDDVPGALNADGFDPQRRDSGWYGLAYYLNYVINDYLSTTGRAEWFGDPHGVRSGFVGDFFEVTTGLSITPFPKDHILNNLQFRPELRWDFSANNPPFNGDKGSQLTAAFDVIYKF